VAQTSCMVEEEEARLWADLQEITVEAEGLLNQEAEEDAYRLVLSLLSLHLLLDKRQHRHRHKHHRDHNALLEFLCK